jgi:hypothetical protein
MAEKSWNEMTPDERAERVRAGREKAKAKREANAARREARQAAKDEALLNTPLSAVVPPEADEADAAPLDESGMGSAEAESPGEDAAAERRRRLLGDIPEEEAALFSDEELLEIDNKAKEKAQANRKARARKDIEALARMHAEVENQILPASVLRDDDLAKYMNEEISDRLDLPPGSMPPGKEGITINGFMYQNGRTYTRPRHVWMSLKETQYRLALSELMFELNNQDKPGRSAREVLHRTVGMRNAA